MKGLLVEKSEEGVVSASVQDIDEARLPADGDVTVAVEYSTVNYKDGLCITGNGGLVR
ncbi:MAG: oxidoreductase, partial [Pseudomonadota bacterium]